MREKANELTLEFIKSQAKSFNVFKLIVDAGTVTISRKFPNWNKNVTSGPSIFATVVQKKERKTKDHHDKLNCAQMSKG